MRIHIKTSRNEKPVPFNYQQNLVGTFHKWMGRNNDHDVLSLYSLSWLLGGSGSKKGLDFPQGANWFISFYDTALAKIFVQGIMDDPNIAFGLKVDSISLQEPPRFSEKHCFHVASPVLVKEKKAFLYFDCEKSSEILTRTFTTKLKQANLDSDGVSVYFDKTYQNPQRKSAVYRGIRNIGNICPVIVEGSPQQVQFSWCVGVGHSTGIGFGALI